MRHRSRDLSVTPRWSVAGTPTSSSSDIPASSMVAARGGLRTNVAGSDSRFSTPSNNVGGIDSSCPIGRTGACSTGGTTRSPRDARAALGPSVRVVRAPMRSVTLSPCAKTKANLLPALEIGMVLEAEASRLTVCVPLADHASTTIMAFGSEMTTSCSRETVTSPYACTSHSEARPTANEGKATSRPAVPRTSTLTRGDGSPVSTGAVC
mmetsp:Transcript_51063/g.136192  ORF Transcript_51063/g.136192 Transcript_51063/m.136192 type:complete len:209 (-) Transcript_51063:522-1148(-)